MASVFFEIASAIRKYVVLSKEDADTVALWCLHTFAFDAFSCTPRLAVNVAGGEMRQNHLVGCYRQVARLTDGKHHCGGRVPDGRNRQAHTAYCAASLAN